MSCIFYYNFFKNTKTERRTPMRRELGVWYHRAMESKGEQIMFLNFLYLYKNVRKKWRMKVEKEWKNGGKHSYNNPKLKC